MSKRRQPGEIAVKKSNHGSTLIKIPEGAAFENRFIKKENKWEVTEGKAEPCILCNDSNCREWPKLEIINGGVGISSSYSDKEKKYLNHISECELEDWPPQNGYGYKSQFIGDEGGYWGEERNKVAFKVIPIQPLIPIQPAQQPVTFFSSFSSYVTENMAPETEISENSDSDDDSEEDSDDDSTI